MLNIMQLCRVLRYFRFSPFWCPKRSSGDFNGGLYPVIAYNGRYSKNYILINGLQHLTVKIRRKHIVEVQVFTLHYYKMFQDVFTLFSRKMYLVFVVASSWQRRIEWCLVGTGCYIASCRGRLIFAFLYCFDDFYINLTVFQPILYNIKIATTVLFSYYYDARYIWK